VTSVGGTVTTTNIYGTLGIPSLIGVYVPYVGCLLDIDLGAFDLTTTGDITAGNLEITDWNTAYSHSQLIAGNPHQVNKTDVGLSNVDNVQQMPLSYLSTNVNLGTSDVLVPSQNAVKTYVDTQVGAENLWDRAGGELYPHTSTDQLGMSANITTTETIKAASGVFVGSSYVGELTDDVANVVLYTTATNGRFFAYDGTDYYDFALGPSKNTTYGTNFGMQFKADTGYVGINDNTPSYQLDVAGDVRAQGNLITPTILFTATDVYSTPPSATVNTLFKYNAAGATTNFGKIVIGKTSGADETTQGYMSFFGKKAATAVSEAMRLEGMNLGIGVADPDSRVEIKGEGATSATNALSIKDSTDTEIFRVRNDGLVTVGNDLTVTDDLNVLDVFATNTSSSTLTVDTTTLVVNKAGYTDKVGIGTATPANDLHCTGGIQGATLVIDGASGSSPNSGQYMRLYYYPTAEAGRMYTYDQTAGTYKRMCFGDWNAGSPPLTLDVGGKMGVSVPYGSVTHYLTVGGDADFAGDLSVGVTDKLTINHNETNATFATTDGGFYFTSTEASTDTDLIIRAQSGEEANLNMMLNTTDLNVINLNATNLSFEPKGTTPLHLFDGSADGITQTFSIYGFVAHDVLRSLTIGLDATTANQALFSGLTDYKFDGEILSTAGATITGAGSFTTGLIVNESGDASGDFRVESDRKTEALFLDASAETLSIAVATSFGSTARSTTANFRRYNHIDLFSVNPAASGATFITPSSDSSGGWRLDADTEYLYFNVPINADWDGASNIIVDVTFEVNIDNSGGVSTDSVDLKLQCFYKGDGETACKTQIAELSKKVSTSPRYKQWTSSLTIDWDASGNVVQVGDVIGIILDLETDTSEVDDIIITDISVYYNTTHIGIESTDV